MNVLRPLELALAGGARLTWPAWQFINRRVKGRTFQPKWAPAPLLKSAERSKPTLGWPRSTDSLCPICVRDARTRILSGEQSVETLVQEHIGEIQANILERDGRVIIEKTCPMHGTFTDTLAINPAFLKRLEGLFQGRDYLAAAGNLHDHGTSSIKYGRGAVLTIDLTNRCNMMCDPCFMDANQVGDLVRHHVHLTLRVGFGVVQRRRDHAARDGECRDGGLESARRSQAVANHRLDRRHGQSARPLAEDQADTPRFGAIRAAADRIRSPVLTTFRNCAAFTLSPIGRSASRLRPA